MKRRNLLVTLGGALGTTGILGSGAFTSVSASRDVTVNVAQENQAYLGLEPSSGPNGVFAKQTTSNELALDFDEGTDGSRGGDGSVPRGSGLGTDSVYEFDNVFQITNQGTQPVYVWATFDDPSDNFQTEGSDIWLYPNGDGSDKLRDNGTNDVLYLGIGQSANIGVHVDTTAIAKGKGGTLTQTIIAGANKPTGGGGSGGEVVDNGGTTIAGPTNGLVSYWPLDSLTGGTVEDVAGTNNGRANGGVSTVTGKVGDAASFDGKDDYVSVSDDPTLDLTDALTLAAWVKPDTSQDDFARIISREQSGVGNRQYNLGLDTTATEPRTVVDTTSSDGLEVSATVTIADDDWHHVAMTFDRTDAVRLYVDGNQQDSTSVSDSLVSRQSPVNLGAPAHLPDKDFFTGRIDETRIYDRALTSTEVSALHNAIM